MQHPFFDFIGLSRQFIIDFKYFKIHFSGKLCCQVWLVASLHLYMNYLQKRLMRGLELVSFDKNQTRFVQTVCLILYYVTSHILTI